MGAIPTALRLGLDVSLASVFMIAQPILPGRSARSPRLTNLNFAAGVTGLIRTRPIGGSRPDIPRLTPCGCDAPIVFRGAQCYISTSVGRGLPRAPRTSSAIFLDSPRMELGGASIHAGVRPRYNFFTIGVATPFLRADVGRGISAVRAACAPTDRVLYSGEYLFLPPPSKKIGFRVILSGEMASRHYRGMPKSPVAYG